MTTRRLVPVDGELTEAIAYNTAINPSLGSRLLEEFVQTLGLIERFPNGWHPLGTHLRQCKLKSFPYAVIYAVLETEIVVVAFANTHRRPSYWRNRIDIPW